MNKYQKWIKDYVRNNPVYGQCEVACDAMKLEFPELELIRGHYYCAVWGVREHWWLLTSSGDIIDPTASQFPSGGIGYYEPWDEDAEEPTGMCPNCGGYCYGWRSLCSEECERSYLAYLNSNSF